MRPQTLDEIVGQDALIGKGKLLRRAIETNRLSSIILWGSAGCGKTTLASVIAKVTKRPFARLNAVTEGLPELRKLIKKAEEEQQLYGRQTILFIDEVHRFNKAQQDGLCHLLKTAPSSSSAPPLRIHISASTAPCSRAR